MHRNIRRTSLLEVVAVLNCLSNFDFLLVSPASAGGGEEATEPVMLISGAEEVADAAELARRPRLRAVMVILKTDLPGVKIFVILF